MVMTKVRQQSGGCTAAQDAKSTLPYAYLLMRTCDVSYIRKSTQQGSGRGRSWVKTILGQAHHAFGAILAGIGLLTGGEAGLWFIEI